MSTRTDDTTLLQRLAQLEERLTASEATAHRALDRGAVENVFNRYMHYHNAYEDDRIIDELWVKPGTEGGGRSFADEGVPFLSSPNLTPDVETGAGSWANGGSGSEEHTSEL